MKSLFTRIDSSSHTEVSSAPVIYSFMSFFICLFITSTEREVKNSRLPGMSQGCYFWDKIGHTIKFVGCRFYSPI